MKTFISTLVILALLVTGFFINYNILEKKTSVVEEKFEALKNSLDEGNSQDIASSYDDTISVWRKHSKYMLIFSNHSDLDSISVSLIKIKERINSGDFPKAKEEVEIARAILKSIPLGETLKIENIF